MLTFSLFKLLLSNALTLRRDKSILYSRVTIALLIGTGLILYQNLYISFLSKGIGLFGGLFYTKYNNNIIQFFIILLSTLILNLTAFFPRKVWTDKYSSMYKLLFCKLIYYQTNILNKMSEQYKIIEYPLIILFIVLGSLFLISTSDLVSIFLSIELQSYGLYLLSTIYRNSESATSGGLMYFLLGGLSSCFILLGTSLLYANSGTTNLDNLYIITSISDITKDNTSNILSWYEPYYIHISLLIMSVGFLFKVSAAPFHFWSPDVYDAIPTVVTTFVAIIPKISIFIFLLELVHYTGKSIYNTDFSWTTTLLFSSLISLIVGAVAGLTQFRIKRLFAYSTISHVGFILLALSIHSIESIQAFFFYLIQYSISNLNAFILIITVGYTLHIYIYDPYKNVLPAEKVKKQVSAKDDKISNLKDLDYSPIQLIDQLKGYYYINPFLALSLSITLFSFVGVPPLIGFFAKQMVLSAALDNGYIFMVLIAILTSVISAVYYLAIVKQIFFDKPNYKLNPELTDLNLNAIIKDNNVYVQNINLKTNNITISSSLTLIISVLTLIILLFMLIPQEWLSMVNILSIILFNI